MQFGYTILYVQDVEVAIDFYERAFGFSKRFVSPGEYGEIETGATRLGFSAYNFATSLTPIEHATVALNQPAPPFELGMCIEDVDAAYTKAVEAGATPVKAPEQKPWGQKVAYVRDLDGFLIEICTPMP